MLKILCIVLFIVASVFKGSTSYGQNNKLRSVKVEFEGFLTESIADISCEEFDYAFKQTKKIRSFSAIQELALFQVFKENFYPIKKQRSINIRGKIVYNYGKTSVKYCFDVFGYFYKDGDMYYNKKLLIYIADKIYNNHPDYLDTLRKQ